MTDQTTVTINNIDYDISNMSDPDVDMLNSLSDLDLDRIDEACEAFVQSLHTQQ